MARNKRKEYLGRGSSGQEAGSDLGSFGIEGDADGALLGEGLGRLAHVGDRRGVVLVGAVGEVHTGDVHSVDDHLLQHVHTAACRSWKRIRSGGEGRTVTHRWCR